MKMLMQPRLISYAQNYEDVILHRALKDVPTGFYIDVGAEDPVSSSVTKIFYDRGWHGINIDACTQYYQKLCAARPRDINVHACAGERQGVVEFYEIPDTGLSTMVAEIAKECEGSGATVLSRITPMVTLSSILDSTQPEVIHFLKVDVEGAEASVLRGIDLKRYRPWIIVMEATKPNTQIPTHSEFEPLLTGAGYQFCYFDGLNRFYVAEERCDNLVPLVALPPNVFDNFIKYEEDQLRRQIEQNIQEPSQRIQDARDALANARQKHFGKKTLKLDEPEPRPNPLKRFFRSWFRPQGSVNKAIFQCLTHMLGWQNQMDQGAREIERKLKAVEIADGK
jgi:FkbM family methyltransferase